MLARQSWDAKMIFRLSLQIFADCNMPSSATKPFLARLLVSLPFRHFCIPGALFISHFSFRGDRVNKCFAFCIILAFHEAPPPPAFTSPRGFRHLADFAFAALQLALSCFILSRRSVLTRAELYVDLLSLLFQEATPLHFHNLYYYDIVADCSHFSLPRPPDKFSCFAMSFRVEYETVYFAGLWADSLPPPPARHFKMFHDNAHAALKLLIQQLIIWYFRIHALFLMVMMMLRQRFCAWY